MPLLELKSVQFAYSKASAPVVELEELNLHEAEMNIIRGPSGCGKTTLLQLIAGLRKPAQGKITFEGMDVTQMKERQRDLLRSQAIGVVFQDFNLIPKFSIEVNLLLAANVSRKSRKLDIHQILATLDLADKAHQPVIKLSRGERQRVAIARALISCPKLLLADEPTASLDDLRSEAVLSLFDRAILESGTSVLIATHDARISDRYEGRTLDWMELNSGGAQ